MVTVLVILQYLHVEYVYALQFLEGRGAECDNPIAKNIAGKLWQPSILSGKSGSTEPEYYEGKK